MNLARNAERLLEQLVDRIAGFIFPGHLHPNELSARLLRVADLASSSGPKGVMVPNRFTLTVDPSDLPEGLPLKELTDTLERVMEEHASDRGWYLAGPMTVLFKLEADVGRGKVGVDSAVVTGPRKAWGVLVGAIGEFQLTNNRCLVGRGEESEITILDETVSRAHAVIIRDNQQLWIEDLGSANSTTVDGVVVKLRTEISMGSVLQFGTVKLSLVSVPEGETE